MHLAGASLTKCTVPTGRPTNRFRDIRKSSRSFSFHLFVCLPFSLHSRHTTFSLLSPERTRCDYLSSRRKLRFPLEERSENNTRQSRIRLVIRVVNIVSKWSSNVHVRKKPFPEKYARDLSFVHTIKYGCAITNYICLTRKLRYYICLMATSIYLCKKCVSRTEINWVHDRHLANYKQADVEKAWSTDWSMASWVMFATLLSKRRINVFLFFFKRI